MVLGGSREPKGKSQKHKAKVDTVTEDKRWGLNLDRGRRPADENTMIRTGVETFRPRAQALRSHRR